MTVVVKDSTLRKSSRLSVDVADTVRPVLKAFTKQAGLIREIPLWQQQAKLTASDAALGDNLGFSVAADGATVAAGAWQASDIGAVYIYVRSGLTWSQQAKLVASDAAVGDFFGNSVALDGDTIIVGARGDDTTGAAYVFVRSGTVWTEQAKLTPGDATPTDFGWSVALDGDTAVIGAPFSSTGAAYVFTRSGTTWSEQAKLVASDGAAGDEFGRGVGIDTDTVVVGASEAHIGPTGDAGAAYIFTRSGTTWTQQAKLVASDADTGDSFGGAVAISSGTVCAGAISDDEGGSSAGAVYVFTGAGATWAQQAKLLTDDIEAGDGFGRSVSVDGDTLVAGTSLEDTGGANAGAAYVFLRSAGAWYQQVKLQGDDTGEGDVFGFSVSLSQDVVICGAYLEDSAASSAGAAYIF